MWNGSEGWLGWLGLRQEIIHIQQFPVTGITWQVVRSLRRCGVVIGCRTAILGKADAGVVQQVVLVVDDRPLPAHEQHGLTVGQQAHLIRREQVARGLLLARAVAAAATSAAAVAGRIYGLLADQLGNILVRTL